MDAKQTHEMEQGTAALVAFAGTLAAYRRTLMAEGFTREESLMLTVAYQTATLDGMRRGKD